MIPAQEPKVSLDSNPALGLSLTLIGRRRTLW